MAGGSVDELRYTRNPHLQPDHARYFQVGRRAEQEISEMDLIFREERLLQGKEASSGKLPKEWASLGNLDRMLLSETK